MRSKKVIASLLVTVVLLVSSVIPVSAAPEFNTPEKYKIDEHQKLLKEGKVGTAQPLPAFSTFVAQHWKFLYSTDYFTSIHRTTGTKLSVSVCS